MINTIENLKDEIIQMASLVEKSISMSTENEFSFQASNDNENQINSYHKLIDDSCFKYMALKTPVAKDLRILLAILKINSDLERMGDQALKVKRNFNFLKNPHPLLTTLKEEIQIMVKNTIDCFTQQNLKLGVDVILYDETINNLHKTTLQNYINLIKSNTVDFDEGFNVIQISKNFERIGDHAKNIAEDVIFMQSGKDIRHTDKDEVKKETE